MRKITRDNYEAWLLDKIEGRLSDNEVRILNAFLLSNPDLEAEMDDEDSFILPGDCISFPGKEKLKKAPAPFEDLSEYEYAMINALEEGTDFPKHTEHMSEYERYEWELYKKTKLEPEFVAYPAKNSLKRHRTGLWINIARASAAVALLLILVNIDGLFRSDSSNSDLIADQSQDTSASGTTATGFENRDNTQQNIEGAFEVNSSEEGKLVKTLFPEQNKIQTAYAYYQETPDPVFSDTQYSGFDRESIIAAEYLRAPDPAQYMDLLAVSSPDPYEQGLKLMIPQYISNSLIITEKRGDILAAYSAPDNRSSMASSLLKRINPISNLSFGNIYDEEGELVAINISADGFELVRRVPSWVNYLR